MLFNADDLQPYLHSAFDHFSKHHTTPFDFVKASVRNRHIPLNFGGNILRLAVVAANFCSNTHPPEKIFRELSALVGSCIMLDSVRKSRPGDALKLFALYMEACDDALDDFCVKHWPCEWVNSHGQRCVNVASGHVKGMSVQLL